jgi:O-antigen ligase
MAGALAVRPEVAAFDATPSWRLAGAVAGAVALAALVVRRPVAALSVLAAFVYLNLSQVLVRQHALPSLMQLFTLPLLVAAWRAAPGGDRGRPLAHPVTLLLALYVAMAVVSTAWARDPEVADARAAELLKALAVFALTALLATTMRAVRAAVWTLLGAGALLGVLALVQAARGGAAELGGLARIKMAHIHGEVFEPRIAGPLGDPNFFAQILVMLVPLALLTGWDATRLSRKLLAFACGALATAATVVTYSRGGALALGCVLALALLARREHVRQALAALAVAGLLFALLPADFTRRLATIEQMVGGDEVLRPDSSFEKRRLLTHSAWLMFLQHPLWGVGVGNYTTRFDEVAEQVSFASRDYEEPGDAHYPHNLYLEVAAETGLPGLVLFGAALAAALIALRRAQVSFRAAGERSASGLAVAFQIALVGYLVSSLFLHGHFPRYLWMLLGFAVGLDLLARARARSGQESHA